MFHALVTGKIVGVQEGSFGGNEQKPISVFLEERVFVNGSNQVRNWELIAGRHKLNWVKRLHERGFFVTAIVEQINGMVDIGNLTVGKTHVQAVLLEITSN